jgi:hypothetical protein
VLLKWPQCVSRKLLRCETAKYPISVDATDVLNVSSRVSTVRPYMARESPWLLYYSTKEAGQMNDDEDSTNAMASVDDTVAALDVSQLDGCYDVELRP